MRQIGNIQDTKHAAAFGDFATLKGIECDIEEDNDGAFAVWVIDDEQIEEADALLTAFQKDPTSEQYQGIAQKADAIREQQQQEEQASQTKNFDSRDLLRGSRGSGGKVTYIVLAMCVATFVLSFVMGVTQVESLLKMGTFPYSNADWLEGLKEIKTGQIWRMVTPVILHGSLLHIIFNMMWFVQLAGMIERIQGSAFVAGLIVTLSIISNLTQYSFVGSNFVGMSGVVYGLVGYIWMREKCDFASGYHLSPNAFIILIVWFFLCFGMEGIANHAHYGGLVGGIAIGYLWSNIRRT
ncbi:rhomboid family intramembrane serine protease [Verrucomicrobia bacterium]|nr:rhomboid family intramembrane serine protease [Verrucomicrobiota bacterium]